MKDRVSVLFVEKGNLDVLDGAFVIVDKTGVRTHIPVGGVACLMLAKMSFCLYHSVLTGYWPMCRSGVRMTMPPAMAWQMSIRSKGSL